MIHFDVFRWRDSVKNEIPSLIYENKQNTLRFIDIREAQATMFWFNCSSNSSLHRGKVPDWPSLLISNTLVVVILKVKVQILSSLKPIFYIARNLEMCETWEANYLSLFKLPGYIIRREEPEQEEIMVSSHIRYMPWVPCPTQNPFFFATNIMQVLCFRRCRSPVSEGRFIDSFYCRYMYIFHCDTDQTFVLPLSGMLYSWYVSYASALIRSTKRIVLVCSFFVYEFKGPCFSLSILFCESVNVVGNILNGLHFNHSHSL